MRHSVAAVVAGLTGAAVMALELTAVRLMAPYFGDSAYVWTNVIGVILVALALGAFLGGRMADKERGTERLFWLLLGAGVFASLVPVIARPLGTWLVPADLPLDSAMDALVRGSFAATTLLFAPPVLLVGCVTPLLVTMLARQDGKVGRASGLVSAMATLGSLIGTFAATHWLIPQVGSRWTVWICSACLVVAALFCRVRAAGAIALLLPVGLSFLIPEHLRPALADEEILAEVESNYQFLQVVQSVPPGSSAPAAAATPRRTSLKINEGLDSFHSVLYEGSAYTAGSYYDYHVIAPYLAGDGRVRPDLRVLSLGEAAGTFGRLYAHVHPGCVLDGVEIDPAVTRLGERFFPGDRPKGTQFPVDARVFVERTKQRYDVVLVDTYKHQIYIPAHVASEQFFAAVHRVLRDGGIVSVNSGGTRFDDAVIEVLCSTMAKVFGEACAFRVPQSRNFVLMARKGARIDPVHLGGVRTEDPELRAILKRAAAASAWRRYGAGTVVLSDDRPFLDVLQEKVYSQRQTQPQLLAIAGDRPPAAVGQRVAALRQEGRLEEALLAIRTSEAPTPMLRLYAGDCRWLLRDTSGALLEYTEAKRLGMEWEVLDDNIRLVGEEIADREKAWAIASRNGWIGGGAFGLLVVSVLLLVLMVMRC